MRLIAIGLSLTGGIYSYARTGFGEFMGFISAYGYWISALLATVSYTTLLFASLAFFFPVFGEGNNLISVIGASIIVWVCWALVCRGVKEAASINILTTIAKPGSAVRGSGGHYVLHAF